MKTKAKRPTLRFVYIFCLYQGRPGRVIFKIVCTDTLFVPMYIFSLPAGYNIFTLYQGRIFLLCTGRGGVHYIVVCTDRGVWVSAT
jgi:hypothetical protein